MDTLTQKPANAFSANTGPKRRDRTSRGTTVELLVQGAHCANCIAKIEKGLAKFDDVREVRFNLSTGKLTVRGDSLRPAALVTRVEALGYKASPFKPSEAVSADEEGERFLLRCLAVAGFGVAFVVPLTDSTQAVWFGIADMGPATRAVINWLVALVACPTAIIASRPFFRSALRGLSAGRANMDVPISLAIILSLALSVYQSVLHGSQTYYDAAVMLTFLLLIGRYLDLRVRRRASEAARQLVAMQAVMVRRLDDKGAMQTIMAAEIRPGDRIILAAGERSPVDGVVDCESALIDTSLVTGESAPVALARGLSLHAGSIVLDRPITLHATAAVENSLVADIARLIEAGQQIRSRYVRLADRAAAAYVPTVHITALAVFVVWLVFLHASFATAITNAIAVLIVTCPCALGLAAPAVQIVATGALFRRGIIVKSGDALERLAEADVAVFDKTGTLTTDRLELSNRNRVSDSDIQDAALLARASRHPLAQAITRAAGAGPVAEGIQEVEGAGLEATIGGAVWRLGRADWVGGAIAEAASTSLWLRKGSSAPICFLFEAPLRPAARETLAALAKRHIVPRILSGDRSDAVAAIGKELAISNWQSGVGPKEKVDVLNSLKSEGRHVLMVGDGINDAAALSLAHVSMSPASASDAAQSAADIVFNGASLAPVVSAVDVARQSRRRVLENFAVATLYNLVAVPLAASGMVTPLIAAIAMASSSLIVTLNALRISIPRGAD
jgi:P-type Cu2+ transporter